MRSLIFLLVLVLISLSSCVSSKGGKPYTDLIDDSTQWEYTTNYFITFLEDQGYTLTRAKTLENYLKPTIRMLKKPEQILGLPAQTRPTDIKLFTINSATPDQIIALPDGTIIIPDSLSDAMKIDLIDGWRETPQVVVWTLAAHIMLGHLDKRMEAVLISEYGGMTFSRAFQRYPYKVMKSLWSVSGGVPTDDKLVVFSRMQQKEANLFVNHLIRYVGLDNFIEFWYHDVLAENIWYTHFFNTHHFALLVPEEEVEY